MIVLTAVLLAITSRSVPDLLEECGVGTARFKYCVLLQKLTDFGHLKLLHIPWNPKYHYCVQRSLPLVGVLNHIHPVRICNTSLKSILTFRNLASYIWDGRKITLLDAPFYIYSTNIRTEYFKHAI